MTLYDAMTALQAEAAGYPAGVRVWMKLMAISFFSGLLFAPWRREALWVVLMAIATMVLLVVGKVIDPSAGMSWDDRLQMAREEVVSILGKVWRQPFRSTILPA